MSHTFINLVLNWEFELRQVGLTDGLIGFTYANYINISSVECYRTEGKMRKL